VVEQLRQCVRSAKAQKILLILIDRGIRQNLKVRRVGGIGCGANLVWLSLILHSASGLTGGRHRIPAQGRYQIPHNRMLLPAHIHRATQTGPLLVWSSWSARDTPI
jgi:hypothetical protein